MQTMYVEHEFPSPPIPCTHPKHICKLVSWKSAKSKSWSHVYVNALFVCQKVHRQWLLGSANFVETELQGIWRRQTLTSQITWATVSSCMVACEPVRTWYLIIHLIGILPAWPNEINTLMRSVSLECVSWPFHIKCKHVKGQQQATSCISPRWLWSRALVNFNFVCNLRRTVTAPVAGPAHISGRGGGSF